MKKQITLSTLSDELREVRTKKKEFLAAMDRLIPWGEWEEKIRPCYYKGERGNKPYELALMIRIHVLQNLYNLADEAVAAEIIDSRAFSDFCGVDSSNQVPNGDTIGRFRNLLIKNDLDQKLFEQVVKLLEEKNLILYRGTIVDSTLIAAPSSTKNRERQRDPEAHQTKKGNQWHFGYKAHIGVDSESGLVHHVKATAANVHDVTVTHELLSGHENTVHGDSGFLGAEKRKDAIVRNTKGRKIRYLINLRPSQSRKLTQQGLFQARKMERRKSSVRAKVEHVFAVIKRLFAFRKTRFRGLRKQLGKLNMLFALANLYLAGRRSLLA